MSIDISAPVETSLTVYAPNALDLPSVSAFGFEFMPNGLRVTGQPTYDDWKSCGLILRNYGDELQARTKAYQLAIGDWFNIGLSLYGEEFSQALDESDYTVKTLADFARVAERTPSASRDAHPDLEYAKFRAVSQAIDDPAERAAWLDECEEKQWSTLQLREAISEAKGRETPGHYATCPACGARFQL